MWTPVSMNVQETEKMVCTMYKVITSQYEVFKTIHTNRHALPDQIISSQSLWLIVIYCHCVVVIGDSYGDGGIVAYDFAADDVVSVL